jgi:uncharacterized ion transporter superfamily protein YfcC
MRGGVIVTTIVATLLVLILLSIIYRFRFYDKTKEEPKYKILDNIKKIRKKYKKYKSTPISNNRIDKDLNLNRQGLLAF